MRTRAATARSAASSFQASIASTNALRARSAGGNLPSSNAGIVHGTLVLLDVLRILNSFMAQNSDSQRSASGAASAARWAEWTASTQWNSKPTGRGWMLRTPARKTALSSRW